MRIKKQEDIRDCGLAILQSFHNEFFDEWIDINTLKQKAKYGKKGINILGLKKLGKTIGVKLTPLKGTFEAFREFNVNKPMIALIGNEIENHYIIVLKNKNQKVTYLDPITGQKHIMPFKKFQFIFLDVLIIVEKTIFIKKIVSEYNFLELLAKFKKHFPILFLSAILTIIFGMINPLLLKIIMDKIIPFGMKNTMIILIIGFSSIVIFGSINNTIRNYIIYKIYLKINFELFEDMNNKLANAKLSSVEKMNKVDIIRRYGLIDSVSMFLSITTFSIFIESGTLLISFSMMLWINFQLLLIGIIGSVIVCLVILMNKLIITKKYKHYIQTQLELNSNIYDFINTINIRRTIKKELMFSKLHNSFLLFKKIDNNIWNSNNFLDMIEEVVISLTPLMIIFLGTTQVINSKLTIGSLVLFLSLFNHFNGPLKSLASIVIKYPLIKKEINMLSFVRQMKLEPNNPKGLTTKTIDTIEFKDFKFGYEEGKTLLSFEEFKIKDSINIMGKNGTGKSTLLNILNFNYLSKGLFINGIEVEFYSLDNLRNQVYSNQPNDFFPRQTVLEYATSGDIKQTKKFMKTITKNGVLELMRDKKIDLEATMMNNAENFSSGQKQLIKLLPLFGRTYSIILIDEGLENLDIETRNIISKKIITEQKQAKFIEISHTGKFISEKTKVDIEEINQDF